MSLLKERKSDELPTYPPCAVCLSGAGDKAATREENIWVQEREYLVALKMKTGRATAHFRDT